MFLKIGALKNFANVTGKMRVLESLFNKFWALRPATSLKRLQHRCFPEKFAAFEDKQQ